MFRLAPAFLFLFHFGLWAQGPLDVAYLHGPCGQEWLDANLETTLLGEDYVSALHEITAGVELSPDAGRIDSLGDVPGDRTAMRDWFLWFNDYLDGILRFESGSGNRIVIFHSCAESLRILAEGRGSGNPFSGDFSIKNYQSVFRHPEGPEEVYSSSGLEYRSLDRIFGDHPEVLFVVVTPPPSVATITTQRAADNARSFTGWLKSTWLESYQSTYPYHDNVLVFDFFDILANPETSFENPNSLRAIYQTVDGMLNDRGYRAGTQDLVGSPDSSLPLAFRRFIQETLFFSQFGGGGGLSADLVLTNPHFDRAVPGTFVFRDDQGSVVAPDLLSTAGSPVLSQAEAGEEFLIPPRGTRTFRTNPQGPLSVGWLQVTSSARLGGVVRFSIPDRGIAGVGAGSPVEGFVTAVRRQGSEINTGVAISNVSGLPIDLDLTLLDADGDPVPGGEVVIEDLPPRGHLALFLDELFPEAETGDFVGTLTVVAREGRVAATVLELGGASGRFTTLPVIPLEE